jgi:hypothetical protein
MQDLINKRFWFKWDEPDGWCEGVVTKIADGKTKRKGCRKVLEYDWALLQYSDCREPYLLAAASLRLVRERQARRLEVSLVLICVLGAGWESEREASKLA